MAGGAAHITNHAVSKITLFFCAGSIYVSTHKTEISQMSGLARRMPWTMAAFALSSAGARGGFSELLDALTVALHARVREASSAGNARAGERASRAIDLVEGAKLRAGGNVNPQLIASAMIRAMSEL